MSVWYKIFSPIVKYIPQEILIRILYVRRFRQFPSLKTPKSFNEKINFIKLKYRNPYLQLFSDRIRVRFFVKSLLGDKLYMPNLLWVGYPDQISNELLERLPERFVVKANHASQCLIFSNQIDSAAHLRSVCCGWMSKDHYRTLGEWSYRTADRCVVIEEYLGSAGQVPDDYKFFVFNGKVRVIQVDVGRFVNHKRGFYDRDWNVLSINLSHDVPINLYKPCRFDEMIILAERLAEDFPFLRVDFYSIKNDIFFGEITVYPGAGFEKFDDFNQDLYFGSLLNIDDLV